MAELCRGAMAELGARERGGPLFVARDGRPEPVEEGLAQLVADPGRVAVVGTLDEVIVGYASGRVEDLRGGHRLGVIDELFVEEPARAVGVGEAMMELLLGWFRAEGCTGVDSTALPGARETKNFFEGSGFSARLLVMHHRLKE
ncbi:MAG: GNAT family N-acetyltransferase [Acidimicrobiales bacterium]